MDTKKIVLIVIAAVLALAVVCVLIGYFTTGSWPWENPGINPDYDPNVPKPDIEDFTGEGGVDTDDDNYDAVIDIGDLLGGN